jgi:hypothetical protein
VTKVEFDPGQPLCPDITAKPLAQLDRIREVMLLENGVEKPALARHGSARPAAPVRHDRRSPHGGWDHCA